MARLDASILVSGYSVEAAGTKQFADAFEAGVSESLGVATAAVSLTAITAANAHRRLLTDSVSVNMSVATLDEVAASLEARLQTVGGDGTLLRDMVAAGLADVESIAVTATATAAIAGTDGAPARTFAEPVDRDASPPAPVTGSGAGALPDWALTAGLPAVGAAALGLAAVVALRRLRRAKERQARWQREEDRRRAAREDGRLDGVGPSMAPASLEDLGKSTSMGSRVFAYLQTQVSQKSEQVFSSFRSTRHRYETVDAHESLDADEIILEAEVELAEAVAVRTGSSSREASRTATPSKSFQSHPLPKGGRQ